MWKKLRQFKKEIPLHNQTLSWNVYYRKSSKKITAVPKQLLNSLDNKKVAIFIVLSAIFENFMHKSKSFTS